jgi:hypothetical protein
VVVSGGFDRVNISGRGREGVTVWIDRCKEEDRATG